MSEDQPYSPANPKQVKKRTAEAKRAAERADEDLRELLATPAFRRFIWVLICERCQMFRTPFNPNGSVLNLNVGRQEVGRELFAAIERIDPKLIPQMMIEYSEARSGAGD